MIIQKNITNLHSEKNLRTKKIDTMSRLFDIRLIINKLVEFLIIDNDEINTTGCVYLLFLADKPN
ncbi:MAG: hypothetical protein A2X08_15175 [Bacteroidetes bacterium GWA2_32_17]|nr:MAG: hypothetical protein A2X08_15175 [Bacteroidetes bacterium GWA2_32_17]